MAMGVLSMMLPRARLNRFLPGSWPGCIAVALCVAGCRDATAPPKSRAPGAVRARHSPSKPTAQTAPALSRDEQSISASQTLAGIDVLIGRNFEPLRGKRIGLVTNQTGVTRDRRATVDVLNKAPGVKLIALFSPEHGLRGQVSAGQEVRSGRDAVTGLPVYSLYGGTRRPRQSTLRGVQALVFDLQDIGSRSYTYIATLGQCMRACAEQDIPLVVLDHPNPLGGDHIEGNIPSARFRSFVGPYPIPYRYGLTIGELARMINGRGWEGGKKCALTVIPLQGYKRTTASAQTGLPWVPTSPNIPHAHTPPFYAATGIVGELPSVSVGIGTKMPFEVVGAPGLNGEALAAELTRRRLPGCEFRTAQWRPMRGVFKGKRCSGVHIVLSDPARASLTRLNFEIMDAMRKVAPEYVLFGQSRSSDQMFDLVCGTNQVRRMFATGKSAAQIWAAWNSAAGFSAQRQPYLLYP
jgi:uncharacterized protein YbbC (DUF1343 family)